MTVALRDHIHLFPYTGQTTITGTEHDNSRYALLMPGMDAKIDTAAHVDYGLTGAAHVYQTLSSGNPITYMNGQLQLQTSDAQKNTLLTLNGKVCWLMLNDHDDDSPIPVNGTNGYKVLVKVTNFRMVNSVHDYWHVFIQVMDITL